MKSPIRFVRQVYIKRMIWIRTRIYALLFKSFGKGSAVLGSITVLKPEKITVGANSSINVGCFLNARDEIVIGNHVHISPFVLVNTGGLDYTKKMEERKIHFEAKVVIHDGVWIGSGAIINPGVVIGENSVIGAGAVVTKDIPANVIALGVPARVVKIISS